MNDRWKNHFPFVIYHLTSFIGQVANSKWQMRNEKWKVKSV